MSRTGSNADPVTAYIDRHGEWRDILTVLRELLRDTELGETIKWGVPTYTLTGKNVVGLAAFKKHCALWFHQGALLKDNHQRLSNAQEGKTRAMRQWRFEAGDRVNRRQVRSYINEAIANARAGKQIEAAPGKLSVPAELAAALASDKHLEAAFRTLTPGRQREYVTHIGGAKQEQTRLTRLDKAKPKILAGHGLNDHYH